MSEATLRRKIEIEEFLGYAKIHTAHHIAIFVDVSDVPRRRSKDVPEFFFGFCIFCIFYIFCFVSLCLTLSQVLKRRAKELEKLSQRKPQRSEPRRERKTQN